MKFWNDLTTFGKIVVSTLAVIGIALVTLGVVEIVR